MQVIHSKFQPFFTKYKYVSLSLMIFMLGLITTQALLDAQQSSSVSSGLTQVIVEVIEVVVPSTSSDQDFYAYVAYWVRKGIGHVGLNSVTGLFLFSTLLGFIKPKNRLMSFFLISLLFSLYGEFLQVFAEGRAPMAEDVFYNFFGYILSLMVMLMVINRKKDLAF